ncbi:hypothetical protein KUTeg_009625 [Tegillarca granosa]|uniref:Uncharacterized protein n=1 Tax=Tegillarca granosa TaxID=220873 RepID=A0ABQ9F8P9_TEGGR|nr:hypothetical protein KUTeg_009625 [Tegillarca granosa]
MKPSKLYKKLWQCLSSPEVVMKSILKSLYHLADTGDVGATYDIHKISEDKRFIRIFIFTWAECLDVIEISIGPDTIRKTRVAENRH